MKRDQKRKRIEEHTSKQVMFKASTKHELINKQSMVILTAITNQLDKIRMSELAKKIDLSLHLRKGTS